MTVDNKPAPRCPYCGGEMKIETFENYTGKLCVALNVVY